MTRPDHQPRHLVLGSASPRRKGLLQAMDLEFEVRTQSADELFPENLNTYEITDYLCELKASVLEDGLPGEAVLLTADTIVCLGDEVLEKPADEAEARDMLGKLSETWHQVYTSVCLSAGGKREVFHARTDVLFSRLDPDMLSAYLRLGNPLDKAGGYGIQEWIGLVGVSAIRGSYTNVVGLPTELVYKKLRDMVRRGF